MKPAFVGAIAVGSCAAAILTCATNEVRREIIHMRKLLPDEINGWKTQDKVEVYDRETIFDYIDGAGEIYLMYDFRKVMVARLVKTSRPTILAEVFDMGSPEDAFGIFSHAGQGEEQGIGQGSEYRGGVLSFWKLNFFVCVTSERETPETQKTVVSLARKIAESIPAEGAKPKLISYLPDTGLVTRSVRYFHKHTSLNYHYFVADQNILKLDMQTEAMLATYEPSRSVLLCVRYPDEKRARDAFNGFLDAYIPEGKESGYAQIDSGKWVEARLERIFVIVVFDAPTEAHAHDLMKAVADRLPN